MELIATKYHPSLEPLLQTTPTIGLFREKLLKMLLHAYPPFARHRSHLQRAARVPPALIIVRSSRRVPVDPVKNSKGTSKRTCSEEGGNAKRVLQCFRVIEMAWKTVSRSTIEHHVIWYNGSGPPPVTVSSCAEIASINELMPELSKSAPDITEDRIRLVCDCRGDPARIEAIVRELLQRLREYPDAASMKVLLYGSTDQSLANGTNIYVSNDMEFLERFVCFRGLLVGVKGGDGALTVSKRRLPPYTPATKPGAQPTIQLTTPSVDAPLMRSTSAELALLQPSPRDSSNASSTSSSSSSVTPLQTSGPLNAPLSTSGSLGVPSIKLGESGSFGSSRFSTTSAAVPATKPIFTRSPSASAVTKPKRAWIVMHFLDHLWDCSKIHRSN